MCFANFIIRPLGLLFQLNSIQLEPSEPAGVIATIKFDDRDATKAVADIINQVNGDESGDLVVKMIKPTASFGNRLHLSAMNLIW